MDILKELLKQTTQKKQKKLEEYEKEDLLCDFGKVVIDDYSCEGFEKSSTPARIIEDE